MQNYLRLSALTITLSLIVPALANEGLHGRYMKQALQGKLYPLLSELQNPIDSATEGERALIENFKSRFGSDRKLELPDSEWPLVNDIILAYREYWIEMLLGEFTAEDQEKMIVARLDSVLAHHGIEHPDSLGTLDAIALEFEKLGVEALTGRTLPHFDLLAWAGNEAQDYQVTLTDGPVNVRVYFMSDFVSYGWSHFATFGRAYPGGWAGADALYCMADDYDRSSEHFKVSYLKHEARHYADYKLFPELKSADLEYRAKLTEILYANESLNNILQKFMSNAVRNAHAPHSLANHEVITQLSNALFNEDYVSDMDRWRDVDPKDISSSATSLLEQHTGDLMAAGADSVEGLVVP